MLKQLTHEEAEALMASEDVIVADVRDRDSYEEDHIANAIHLSMPKLQEFVEEYDKNTPILVYCYHGISSQSVGQHLIEQGFTEVYSLVGGFEAWKAHHSSSTDS
ncbi:MAG: thiosulfate sulfurtransferase GlpE [Coxiellaceae bacterium]|nr:thiosulfate sulfurtransferase GlpE [Coxiellaceae bacterium]